MLGVYATHFAIILPGRARLSVCFLPFVGLNTAVGFDVSTAEVDGSSLLSLRFYFVVSMRQCIPVNDW